MGRAAVYRFLDEGGRVVAADLNEINGLALMAEVANEGRASQVRFIRADVASEPDVTAMIAEAEHAFGRLDIVCNNAGIGGAFGSITDLEVDDWDETFSVLVRGVFLGTKHAVRQMRAQGGGGSIINTASVAGLSGGAGPVAYSAAKAAVINLTKSTALELANDRIRVNAICPGLINTPLANQGRRTDSFQDAADRMQPWPDIGQPDDIAHAMVFLASDESAFITGEAIVVDGGLTAAGPSAGRQTTTSPSGWVGMNRGTTGNRPTVRRRE